VKLVRIGLISFCLLFCSAALIWISYQLIRPNHSVVGAIPSGLSAETVQLNTRFGTVAGWYLKRNSDAALLLLHGLRSNRTQMLGRAKFLAEQGYSVLLVDLYAHGESDGDRITFGLKESSAVPASVRFLKERGAANIGAIGLSLGSAAVLLSERPTGLSAAVLESPYATLEQAVENRLRVRIGGAAKLAKYLLLLQAPIWLGVSADRLRPLEAAATFDAPTLIVGGEIDLNALPAEAKGIYARINQPKELWLIKDAGHVDFHSLVKEEYERRVTGFFNKFLLDSKTKTSKLKQDSDGRVD
jgi:uncharacterized protein